MADSVKPTDPAGDSFPAGSGEHTAGLVLERLESYRHRRTHTHRKHIEEVPQ